MCVEQAFGPEFRSDMSSRTDMVVCSYDSGAGAVERQKILELVG